MRYKVVLLSGLMIVLSACATAPVKPAAPPPVAKDAGEPAAVPELADKSIPELETMVAAGNIKAQVELGWRYAFGRGVEKNYDKSVALFKAAADRNDAQAEYAMGTAYMNGVSVPKSEAIAVSWFERSAAQHYALADYWLGFMIGYGRGGINHTWAGAVPYLWDAAIQGDSNAEALLGWVYDQAPDVDHNLKAAAYWYRRARTGGLNPLAENNLLLMINRGQTEWQPGDPGSPPKHDDSGSPPQPGDSNAPSKPSSPDSPATPGT